jgi:hypothetical protein
VIVRVACCWLGNFCFQFCGFFSFYFLDTVRMVVGGWDGIDLVDGVGDQATAADTLLAITRQIEETEAAIVEARAAGDAAAEQAASLP